MMMRWVECEIEASRSVRRGACFGMSDHTCALTVDGRNIATCDYAGMNLRRGLICWPLLPRTPHLQS